jgi:hypothetical protein
MLNSLQLVPHYRDTWGYYDAMVNPIFAPLDHNVCYKPKLYEVPDLSVQLMDPTDATGPSYQQYTLRIVPGSLIIGFLNDDDTPLFTLQITDLATGLRFWDQPISNYFISNNFNEYPNLLSSPWPVVGRGLFNVELWDDPTNRFPPDRNCFTMMVAEAQRCPDPLA